MSPPTKRPPEVKPKAPERPRSSSPEPEEIRATKRAPRERSRPPIPKMPERPVVPRLDQDEVAQRAAEIQARAWARLDASLSTTIPTPPQAKRAPPLIPLGAHDAREILSPYFGNDFDYDVVGSMVINKDTFNAEVRETIHHVQRGNEDPRPQLRRLVNHLLRTKERVTVTDDVGPRPKPKKSPPPVPGTKPPTPNTDPPDAGMLPPPPAPTGDWIVGLLPARKRSCRR